MRHRATSRFWENYRSLDAEIRRLADGAFEILKVDARHPSLHLKKVGRFWSVRVGLHYRALAVESEGDVVWFWIGHHGQYDRLIK